VVQQELNPNCGVGLVVVTVTVCVGVIVGVAVGVAVFVAVTVGVTVGVALVWVGVFVGVGVGYDIIIVGPSPFELITGLPFESVILTITSPVCVNPLGVLMLGVSVYVSVDPSGYVIVPPEIGFGVIVTLKQLIPFESHITTT
jgi:hypothetical protein